MFNARDAFSLLAESDKLDDLLTTAKKMAHPSEPGPASTAGLQALDDKAAQLQAMAKQGAAAGQSIMAQKLAARAQKVAYVQHMLNVLDRIS
jgi:hypothetical protein